ncbi:YihY/virulence factor BrkB family protein [Bdellovibrio sp. HCB337]|uniref:YihY/virulence factor BrkB family protein n=1 Tax=Bdellovibrio sp. HCB337 TaxID=3394358 RepID=UPI0039A773DF
MTSKLVTMVKDYARKTHLMGKDLIHQLRDGEIQLVAASLSFSTILSLVPFLAVILATFKFMGGDDILYTRVENLLLLYFKEAGGAEFVKVIKFSIRNIQAGSLGASGAVILVLTTFRLMHDMEHGIHRVWNQKNTRPLLKRFFMYWFLVVILPVFLAIYVGFTTLIRMEFGKKYVPGSVTGYTVLAIILYFAYKYVPDLKVKAKSAFFSAVLATVGLGVVQNTFTWVTVKFFRFNNIYGSFAFLPIFLIWILTIWYVILGGVAICASTQRRQLLEIDENTGVL